MKNMIFIILKRWRRSFPVNACKFYYNNEELTAFYKMNLFKFKTTGRRSPDP